jgi:hypothetical protein
VSRVVNATPAPLLGNPFEVLIGALCVFSGLPSLLNGPRPTSIEALLPPGVARVWGAELVIGGLLIVVGVLTRRHRIERAGLFQLGPAAIAYGLAIMFVLGWSGAVAGAVLAAFGTACLARGLVLAAADKMRAELLEIAADWSKFPPEPD